MDVKALFRVAVVLSVTSAQMPEPAHGQGKSAIRSNVVVRVAEAASSGIHLTPSTTPLSAVPGIEGSGRALASADFDEDGVPDLVIGYADARGGRLVVQRGNVDAIYPNSPEANARRARGEFSAAAFHMARGSLALPEAADFLGAGDFDADGHWDIVAAQRGGTKLHWLRGDGRGNFDAARAVDAGGTITALAAGEVNRRDGLSDVAVGVVTADGARVLVFEGACGALVRPPESFAVAAPAVDLAFGELDDDAFPDLAIASGSEVVVVHGRDRRLSLDAERQAAVGPAKLTRSDFEAAVMSIAIGDFTGDVRKEVATLTANRVMTVLNRDGSGTLTMTSEGSADRILAAKVSALPKDDLLLFGGSNEVRIATTHEPDQRDAAGTVIAEGSPRLALSASISAESAIVAVLPLRLNSDALKDLVLVPANGGPTVIESQSSIFVVNSTARTSDVAPGNGVCADPNGECTFAAAIEEANALAGPDTIHFNIPGGGVPTVSTHASLEFAVFNEVYQPVTIDGTTQPGGRVEINSDGFIPLIFYGGSSVLRGVAIYGQNASLVVASANNIIEGNYVGFRPDGSKPSFGSVGGINFRGGVNSSLPGNNNLLGGTTAQARNVISNCDTALSLPNTTGNVIQGNYVGVTIDGTAALANGISLNAGDSMVTVGGATAGAGNVFAGATNQGTFSVGLNIGKASLIQGNKIGTSADGLLPIPMRGSAIQVFTNESVTIGGTTPAARNIIAACFWGIQINHDSGEATLIQGNRIGTNAAGTGALPNLEVGLQLSGTRGVVIGGTASGAGNLISGNTKNGLELLGGINGTPCRNVVIQGNLIGTDASGTIALPNQESGFYLAATDNAKVGGTTAGERNLISGNTKHGLIVGNATANPGRIQGNFIGVNIFGTGALGNGQHGIHIDNFGGHLIGGTDPGAGNVIAFNGGAGIASSFRDYLGGPILSNSIFANRGLGLDRLGNGVTPYSGSYSEAPVITSINTSGSETVISGNLRTQTFGPQTTYTIQFFSNTSLDPSGYGEGQSFIGQTTITAGQGATVPFSATITPAVPPGRYVSAVAIGVYDTQYNGIPLTSEFSFCARVAGDPTPENTPLHLNFVTPMVGGDTGATMVTIIGEGISQGATVVLRRAGQPDILGGNISVSADGSAVRAILNLTGMAIGGWDVVVTNADGSTFTIAGGFTVETGREARVFVDILGRDVVRPGRSATFTVLYGNRGNNDQYGVPLFVSGIPRDAKVTLGFEILPIEVTPDMSPDLDPNQTPPVIQTPTEQVLWLVLPVVPGGSTGVYRLTIEVPNNENNFSLKAFASAPLLTTVDGQSFARGNMLRAPGSPARLELSEAGQKCLDSLLANSLDCLLNFIPGVDCFKATVNVGNFLRGLGDTIRKGIEAEGIAGKALAGSQLLTGTISAGLGVLKCAGDTVPPIGFALDVLSCVLSGISVTVDCAPYLYEKLIKPVFSRDPNDKVGAGGAGLPHYITGEDPLRYMIFFENKADASAAAQDVVITDQLDVAKFDLSTFELGPIAFGDHAVTPPPGLSQWTTDVDLRPANELIVRVIAGLDPTTGIVTWRFISLDPATMQPTDDPLAGFLPPNKVDMEGEGNVLFTIEAKPGQPTGTEIRNKARIVFDTNAPIDTPEYLNTLDNAPPASQVLALPATNASSSFQVSWTGSDANAGVAAYAIYVSENGGTYILWITTSATSAIFEGRPNATYSFYSRARDGAGNVEAPPGPADTSTVTLSGQLLNIATRLRVQTGENVLIGGLIVTGTEPKKVIIRGIGPSLSQFFAGALPDPTLDLYQGSTLLASNDNWKDSQQAEIEATTIPPTNDFESAIVRTLAPGAYTAVMSGKDGGTGIGVVEAYDLDQAVNSKLANIATRGFVDSGDNVMIGGVIAGGNGGADTRVLIRAIGPSLTNAGINGALQDPTLELRDANGALLRENDNWQADQQGEIEATTIPPTNVAESAIVATLTPGNYTAIVRGKSNSTGVAVVEVYNVE